MIENTPPFDLVAEDAVIGSILLDPEVLNELIPFLKPEHFYQEKWRQSYALFMEMWEDRRAIDLVVIKREIEARKWAQHGFDLAQVIKAVPSPAHAAHYGRIVLENAQLRALRDMAQEVAIRVSEKEDPKAIAAAATAIAASVSESMSLGTSVVRAKDGILSAVKAAQEEGDDEVSSLKLPWLICPRFDHRGAVIRATDFPIVAARPGVGKTTFALQWAKLTSQRTKAPVVYISLETPARDLWLKVACCHSGVPEPRGHRMTAEASEKLSAASSELDASCPLYIVDAPPARLQELLALMRRLKERLSPRAFVIDYLGLIEVPGTKGPYEATSKASRTLRNFALQEGVGVMAVHQLSRAMEKEKRPPMMSDLRDSGQLEQDATHIVFLHQERISEENDQVRDVVAILAKARRGGAPHVQQLRLLADISRFTQRQPGPPLREDPA